MRRPRTRASGFTMLELIVAIGLIAVFASVLLDRLLYYQEAYEKAQMEYWASALKVGLQVRVGHLMAQNQVIDYTQIARENPMSWLDEPAPGYRGEVVATADPKMPPRSWYFDRTRGELIYVAGQHRYLQLDGDRRPHVHFRVRVVRPDISVVKPDLVLGLQLVAVDPYRWF